MLLKILLANIYQKEIPAEVQDIEITAISCDSRKVQEGTLFVALKGAVGHGEKFIQDAIARGSRVVITDQQVCLPVENKGVGILRVNDSHLFLKEILNRFYGDPSRKVKTIGITGTNGKTTITYLLESIFAASHKTCGVIGTVNYRYGKKVFPAKNTTPGLVDNYQHLYEMSKAKIDYCAIETSSHALVQGRVDGIDFLSGIFTNLTSDHMDYHHNREEYFKAKAILFKNLLPDALAVINNDDPYARKLKKMTSARVKTYGLKPKADLTAKKIKLSLYGTIFTLKSPTGNVDIHTPLVGPHNIYNILAAAAVCLDEGVSLEQLRQGVEQLKCVPGRLEQILAGQNFHVFVDYAHTEDALKNVLSSIKKVSKGRIILVFGCGGDRDKTKRPKMGNVASRMAHFSFITNDNPRSEEPQDIVNQILVGFKGKKYQVILDRREAISAAVAVAKKGDVVLIAGKGHEDYQIFKDKTVSFKEKEIVQECLEKLGKGHQL